MEHKIKFPVMKACNLQKFITRNNPHPHSHLHPKCLPTKCNFQAKAFSSLKSSRLNPQKSQLLELSSLKLLNLQNIPIISMYQPPQRRGLALWGGRNRTHPCDGPPEETKTDECPKRSCNQPKGWFSWLFRKKEKPPPPPSNKLPDVRCCRKKYCRKLQSEPDPDFSEFGGQAYKTCGIAYVIQRDRLQPHIPCESREDKLLRLIETHPDLHQRRIDEDPIQDSDNLYTRLVQMSDLGLHPFYKKIAATPLKEGRGTCKHVRPYRAHSLIGPLDYTDLPAQVKINRSQLERKNLYWSYKYVTPPESFEGRIMETKEGVCKQPIGWTTCKREKATVFDVEKVCPVRVKRDRVFDTLKQKPMDFSGVCTDDEVKKKDRSEFVYHPTC